MPSTPKIVTRPIDSLTAALDQDGGVDWNRAYNTHEALVRGRTPPSPDAPPYTTYISLAPRRGNVLIVSIYGIFLSQQTVRGATLPYADRGTLPVRISGDFPKNLLTSHICLVKGSATVFDETVQYDYDSPVHFFTGLFAEGTKFVFRSASDETVECVLSDRELRPVAAQGEGAEDGAAQP